MEAFHIIQDAQVILRSKGIWSQHKVYRRGNRVYAGVGKGFVRLGPGDATSNPNMSWEDIELPVPHTMDRLKGPLLAVEDAATITQQVIASAKQAVTQ